MNNKFLVLDVETGGLNCLENPITQVAACIVDPITLREVEAYETYVQPYGQEWVITKEALAATQTDLRKINAGLPYKQACAELIRFIKSANSSGHKQSKPILVGHNIGFDIDFLIVLFHLCGKNLWDFIHPIPKDTIVELKETEAGLLSKDESTMYRLTVCCERMGIKLKNAHGAMNDVRATHQLFKAIIQLKRASYKAMRDGTTNINLTEKQDAEQRSKSRSSFFFEI